MSDFLNAAMQKRFGSPGMQQANNSFSQQALGWGGLRPMETASTNYGLSDYGLKAPAAASSFGLMEEMPGLGIDASLTEGLNLPKAPGKEGAWLKPANFGLGVAQVGLGLFNAMDQAKMNKFMRGYYGDQVALQKADYANAARSSNQALESKYASQLSAMGMGINSEANKKGTADYMSKWGAKETV